MQLFRALLARSHDAPVGAELDLPSFGNPLVLGGSADLEVVGESYYQGNLRRIVKGIRGRVRIDVSALLHPEVDNHYDPNAVSVWVEQLQVGYLPRDDAQRYRPGLFALQQQHGRPVALRGQVVGEDMLGVFLRHDPRDFGVDAHFGESEHPVRSSRTPLVGGREVADAGRRFSP